DWRPGPCLLTGQRQAPVGAADEGVAHRLVVVLVVDQHVVARLDTIGVLLDHPVGVLPRQVGGHVGHRPGNLLVAGFVRHRPAGGRDRRTAALHLRPRRRRPTRAGGLKRPSRPRRPGSGRSSSNTSVAWYPHRSWLSPAASTLEPTEERLVVFL